MRLLHVLFLLLILNGFSAKGQNLDSLELLLETETEDTNRILLIYDLCWGYAHSAPDKTLEFCNEAMEIIKRIPGKDSIRYARINYYYGCAYKTKASYDKSLFHFENYKRVISRLDNKRAIGSVLYQIGVVYQLKGEYDIATKNYLEALELYRSGDLKYSIATTLNVLGNLDRKLNQTEKAKERYQEALEIFKTLDDDIGQADVFSNLGNLYEEIGDHENALKSYLSQKEMNEKANYEIGLGYAYENLSNLYRTKGDFQTAKINVEKALAIRKKVDDVRSLCASYVSYGKLLLELQLFDEAKFNLDKGLELSLENDMLPETERAYEALSYYFAKIGKADEAIKNYKLYTVVKDSILNKDVALQMNSLEAKYENSEKEKEILELNTENEKKDIRNFWMTIGLVLSILLASIIFYFLRQRQKTNLLLKEKNDIISKSLQEKNILLKEIHHRVKNNLQVISSLLNLQSHYIEDSKAIEAINEGRNRVQSMALIHQSLYQKDNLVGIEAKAYFEKLISELFHTYKVDHDKVNLEVHIQELQLDVDTMIPLGLIMNELVTNSLKYAFEGREKGNLFIHLTEENQQLILKVKDDGIGMDNLHSVEESDSFGYQLIDAFVAKMDGNINIESDNGTSVEIVFNQYEIAE